MGRGQFDAGVNGLKLGLGLGLPLKTRVSVGGYKNVGLRNKVSIWGQGYGSSVELTFRPRVIAKVRAQY